MPCFAWLLHLAFIAFGVLLRSPCFVLPPSASKAKKQKHGGKTKQGMQSGERSKAFLLFFLLHICTLLFLLRKAEGGFAFFCYASLAGLHDCLASHGGKQEACYACLRSSRRLFIAFFACRHAKQGRHAIACLASHGGKRSSVAKTPKASEESKP
jgi:hypothetical protein